MKILHIAGADTMMGINQNEYFTVPLRMGTEVVQNAEGHSAEVHNMTAAFKPTPEELEKLNEGASIHLTVLGKTWAPMRLVVQDPPTNPDEPADFELDQGHKQGEGLQGGQFTLGTVNGAITVITRSDPCVLQEGDEIIQICGEPAEGLVAVLNVIARAYADGIKGARCIIRRGEQIGEVYPAIALDDETLRAATELGFTQTTSVDRAFEGKQTIQ